MLIDLKPQMQGVTNIESMSSSSLISEESPLDAGVPGLDHLNEDARLEVISSALRRDDKKKQSYF